MVIVGHMSSKSTFGAKNTGQKFLTPKNFWWCRNVCPDSCPGVIFGAGRGSALFFRGGAGQSWKFSGPGRPGAAISPGAGAGRASLMESFVREAAGKEDVNLTELSTLEFFFFYQSYSWEVAG